MGRVKTQIGNCSNGCNKPKHTRDVCKTCYKRLYYEEHERNRRGATKHIIHPLLTIQTDVNGYQRIKTKDGLGPNSWEKYHRYIMEQFLGRKLKPYENIHHKNGNRSDNRLENLELWVTKQPKGQRPKDLLEYANWIIKTYNEDKS